MSQMTKFFSNSGPGGYIQTLTGNTGGAVPPTAGNIDILGSGVVSVAGNAATSTLTISVSGAVATTYTEDTGVASPALGNINFFGDGVNIKSTGAGSTVTYSLFGTTNHAIQLGNAAGNLTSLGVATNGQLPIGSTGADPVLATLTSGANITITNGAGSISIAANASSQVVNYTGITHASSPYTVLSTDYYISADVTGGTITVLLPNAPATGRIFVIKDKVGLAATSNITVVSVSGLIDIDGNTSFVLNTAYEAISLIWNGASYEIY